MIWHGQIGGAIGNLHDFVRNAPPDDFDITLCCLSRSGPALDPLVKLGVNVVEIGAASSLDIRAFLRFLKFLKSQRFDVIHNNTITYFGHIALALVKGDTPCIYHEHGGLHTHGDERKTRLFYKFFQGIYDLFLTVSDYTESSIEAAGVCKNKIENIGNPIDLKYMNLMMGKSDAKRLLGLDANLLMVGTACRFVHQKDLPLFLNTAKEINFLMPEVHFVLVGEGPDENDLRKLAQNLGIESVVHFLGPRNDIPVIFHAFDLYLLTSYQESFCRTFFESLAVGTPVTAVLPLWGGGKDFVQKAEGVVYTAERNSSKLAELACSLLNNTDMRRLMGQQGREWIQAQKEFHVEEWVKRLNNVYSSLVGKGC